jgi:Ca2+-binding EF-hand superfamily protein
MSNSEALKLQEERHKLMDEVFDLYDPDNLGYVFRKDALKILSAMGRVLDPEDETDFLSMVDPKNEGRVLKKNFLAGVEAMYTIPDNFMPEIKEAFETFDKNKNGKIKIKDFKDLLLNLSGEYKEKDLENLFNILGINMNDDDKYINIDEFINAWRFQ